MTAPVWYPANSDLQFLLGTATGKWVMVRSVRVVFATVEARSGLGRMTNGRANLHRERFRARIVLRRLAGVSAGRWDWSSRFDNSGLAAIEGKSSRGFEPSLRTTRLRVSSPRHPGFPKATLGGLCEP
jgi:hypothetical protein